MPPWHVRDGVKMAAGRSRQGALGAAELPTVPSPVLLSGLRKAGPVRETSGWGVGGTARLGSCCCGCGSSSGFAVSSEPSGANGPPGTRWLSCVCPTRHSARGVTGQGHCASEIVFSTLPRAFHSAVTQWAPCVQGAVPGELRRRGCPRAPCLLSLQCSWGSKERDRGQS